MKLTEHVPSAKLRDSQTIDTQVGQHFNPWSGLSLSKTFFENDEIASLLKRALFYARAGIPLHFCGAAGQGKTSFALAIARRLGRPVTIMTGNDWLSAEDMIGKEVGQSSSTVIDKYVQSVRRTENKIQFDWQDSLLAKAMERGHTLVYDEFTRSSSAVNGILLSVLEEGILISTDQVNARSVIKAHPDFRMILTSNPQEYVGINAAPDALMDRMITFKMQPFSEKTESGIVAVRTGLEPALASRIVRLVRSLRSGASGHENSMRSAIIIARIAMARLMVATLSDTLLAQIATDVLNGRGGNFSTSQIVGELNRLALSPEAVT